MLITRIWREQPGKYFCISTKSSTGRWRDTFFARRELSSVQKFIRDNHDKDIYFCPHGFDERSRVKEHAVLPTLLWADMDEVDPRGVELRPSIAIESSPGRFVGLWRVDRTVSEEVNQRLSYAIGCDKSGWDLTQVLRVPSTVNYKYETMPRVRTLWLDGPEYTLRDIERKLPAVTSGTSGESDAADVYKTWERKLPHWCRRELMHGRPQEGKRSEMVWKIGNTLIESGVPREDAFTLLKASPWNKFRGRRNEDEQLRRELDKSVNKHMNGRARIANDEDDYVWLARSLADVHEENIDWIWYPYLARSEITILEGDPGLGKSYLAQMMSGSIIDGTSMPSVKEGAPVSGVVVYFDIENSAGSITVKRIRGNGFKHLEKYIQEEAIFSIDDEDRVAVIMEALERIKPTLVVFDTINTYLGKADAFKGHEAQQAFAKFRHIAKRFNCAVLVLRHLTKSTKERALYRGQGSIAFAGLARVVLTVGSMPDDEDTRVMAVTKLNITRKPKSLTFRINALPDTLREKDRSRFEWGEFVDLSSDEIVSAVPKTSNERQEAIAFLQEVLGEGEIELKRIERMAEARSISIRTLQRAADEVGVNRTLTGFGKDKRSLWSLANSDTERSRGAES